MVKPSSQLTSTISGGTQIIHDAEELLARSMREFIVDYSDSEAEEETSVVPSSSGLAGQSVSSSPPFDLAAKRAKRRREKQAGYKRKERKAKSTEAAKYRFDKLESGEYIMMSAMDNIPLRTKVANSLRFAPKMSSEHQSQLTKRLNTLIGCLEVRHLKPYFTDGTSHRARGHRKRELCQKLTALINSRSSDHLLSMSMDYDEWDDELRGCEAKWMTWHPEDKGKFKPRDEVVSALQADLAHIICSG
jgi:hypothetical protein